MLQTVLPSAPRLHVKLNLAKGDSKGHFIFSIATRMLFSSRTTSICLTIPNEVCPHDLFFVPVSLQSYESLTQGRQIYIYRLLTHSYHVRSGHSMIPLNSSYQLLLLWGRQSAEVFGAFEAYWDLIFELLASSMTRFGGERVKRSEGLQPLRQRTLLTVIPSTRPSSG